MNYLAFYLLGCAFAWIFLLLETDKEQTKLQGYPAESILIAASLIVLGSWISVAAYSFSVIKNLIK